MGAACSEVEDAEAPERGAKSTSLEEWRRHRFEKNPEFCSFDQLARPLNVLRDGILARKDNEPVLLVGPVLGRVTDTSASFLVEVSEEIDVNISIVQVNGFRGPLDRHVYPMGTSQDFQQPSLVSLELDRTFFSPKSAVCCVQRLKPGMPVTFQLQNLLSDSPYMVFVSNIPDLELRNPLRFRTMPLRVERLRLVAIGDYAASNFGTMAGEDSEEGMDPWRELLKTVKAGAAEPHVALHLGRNSATHLFEEVMDSLKEHQSYCEGPKQTMLRRARDLLRESYRTTLGGHRQLRAILAQLCSNICVFMPPLELPKILEQIHELETKAKQTGAEVTLLLGDLHQLLCLALEVYQEYERAMWDGSFHLSLDYLRLGRGWLHTPLPMVSHEPEPASTEYIVDAGEISDSVEEWHIHRYGSVTIMVLDTKGHAITAALTGTKSKQILSEKQWDAIEEVLADEVAQVLLFVSELPLALEESEARRSLFHENSAEVLHEDGTALDHPLRHGRWTMSWDMAAGIWDGHGHDSRQVVKKASKGSFEKGLGEDAKDSGHVAVNATDMGSKGSLKGFGEDAEDSGHVALSKTDKGSKGSLEKGLREDAESSGHVVLNKTDKGSKGSLEKGVGENAEESEHVALNATDMGSKGSLEKGLGEGAENSGHVVLNKTDKGSKGSLEKGVGENAEDSGHVALNATDMGSKGSLEKGLGEDAENSGHVVLNKTDKGSKGSLEKGVGENAEDSGHVALNAIDMGLKGSLERGLGEDTENSGNAALSKIDKGSKGSLEKGFEEDNDHFGLNKGCEGSVGKDFVEDAADPDFALKEVSKLFKEALEEEVKQVDLPSAADEGVDSSLQSPLTWKDSRLEQETLLEKLFDWKKVQPSKREVVLLNGADFSSTGTLSDTRLDMSIPVVLAGVVEGHSRGHHPWKLDADLPGGRFKYSYEEPIMDHWGLPFLDITVTEDQVAVQISMVTGRRKQHVHAFPSTARAGRARGH